MNIPPEIKNKIAQNINWTDICLPETVIILFNNSFTSSKRTIVRIKSVDPANHLIVTTPPTCENQPDVIPVGSVLVAQISRFDGAVRFPVNLVSINKENTEHCFAVPEKNILIKHHNSLRVNTYLTGSIFDSNGSDIFKVEEPILGNLSNTGLRLILEKNVFRLRTRYFIVFILKHNLNDPDELSFSLKCKWNVSRIREFVIDNTTKYEIAGYFIFDDQDRDKLENFLSIQYK